MDNLLQTLCLVGNAWYKWGRQDNHSPVQKKCLQFEFCHCSMQRWRWSLRSNRTVKCEVETNEVCVQWLFSFYFLAMWGSKGSVWWALLRSLQVAKLAHPLPSSLGLANLWDQRRRTNRELHLQLQWAKLPTQPSGKTTIPRFKRSVCNLHFVTAPCNVDISNGAELRKIRQKTMEVLKLCAIFGHLWHRWSARWKMDLQPTILGQQPMNHGGHPIIKSIISLPFGGGSNPTNFVFSWGWFRV